MHAYSCSVPFLPSNIDTDTTALVQDLEQSCASEREVRQRGWLPLPPHPLGLLWLPLWHDSQQTACLCTCLLMNARTHTHSPLQRQQQRILQQRQRLVRRLALHARLNASLRAPDRSLDTRPLTTMDQVAAHTHTHTHSCMCDDLTPPQPPAAAAAAAAVCVCVHIPSLRVCLCLRACRCWCPLRMCVSVSTPTDGSRTSWRPLSPQPQAAPGTPPAAPTPAATPTTPAAALAALSATTAHSATTATGGAAPETVQQEVGGRVEAAGRATRCALRTGCGDKQHPPPQQQPHLPHMCHHRDPQSPPRHACRRASLPNTPPCSSRTISCSGAPVCLCFGVQERERESCSVSVCVSVCVCVCCWEQ